MNKAYIKDALYNLTPTPGASPEYAKGILVGVISVLAANSKAKWPYDSAVKQVKPLMPKVIIAGCIPNSWRNDFLADGEIKEV